MTEGARTGKAGDFQEPTPTVDILMTVYNGLPYLEEQIASIQEQTHTRWRLWVRDDGSSDETVRTLARLAEGDPRIRLAGGTFPAERLGARGGFARLMSEVPPDAAYVMFADADDRWVPEKVAITLARMVQAELADGTNVPGPTLVHTDLAVVDRDLRAVAPSLWAYQGLRPERITLNRLLIQNCVTGCTVMINRPLLDLSVPVPEEAVMHDWWLALVARATGRVAHLPSATVLYRQHGRNDTGARPYPRRLGEGLRRSWNGLSDRASIQDSLGRTGRQAGALHERLADRVPEEVSDLIRRYAEIPGCGPIGRRVRLLQLGTLPQGPGRGIGLLLRA